MAKPKGRRGLGLSALKAAEAGRRSAEADLRVEEHNAQREGVAHLLPVASITARPSADIRPVDEGHVASLVESIRALGLMQPICVDRAHRLVAGAHRLAAYRLLAEEDPQRWGRVPVVVDPDLDAAEDPERALRKEIAENEKRRNLTPAEVQGAAQRLMAHDPSFTRKAGRLKAGERPLTPFLADTFGVSVRHVRALLNTPLQDNQEAQNQEAQAPQHKQKAQDSSDQASPLDDLKRKVARSAQRLLKEGETGGSLSQDPALKALLEALLKHAKG